MGGILAEQTASFVDGEDTVTDAAVAIAKGKKAVRVLGGFRPAVAHDRYLFIYLFLIFFGHFCCQIDHKNNKKAKTGTPCISSGHTLL